MFAGRERRDALIDGEVKRSLQTMEMDLQHPGWAAEKLDQEASALWLSQRVDQSKDEIDRNFAGISRAYFGRELTPSAVYDEIVRHEAETAQMALQPVSQPQQAKQAAPVEAGKTDKKEVKSWQFLRTAGASFEKTGQDTAAGVFSMIEGALNTMGGTPEKVTMDEIHRSNISALSGLESRELGNTPEAQRLRSIVEAKARDWDQDFLARKAEWENSTVRGALSSTAREHADFFFELGKESYDRYGSDADYRETYVGMAAQMSGQMVASSALMGSVAVATVGRAGVLGAKAVFAGAMAAGTAQGFANATQNRREYMGEDYRNEGWQFMGDLAIGGVQQAIEYVPFLDNALELAVKASSRGGSVTMGQVLRQFPKQAAKSGAVEGAEEVLQGAWEDFIVDMAYDDERVVNYGVNMDYIKRRAGEAFAGFAGGVMMKGMVAPFEMADQNIMASKVKKLLTAKDGGTFGPNDVKLLAQARSDEEILAMPEGALLLKATKGDEAARTEYNSKIITQNFKPTDGLVLPNGEKLGEYEGRPMLLAEDGQFVVFDMSDSEEATRWNNVQQHAVNYAEMVKLNEDLKGEDALQATSDMVEYVKQLQAERGGITTIETDAKIAGPEAQFGRVEAEKKVAEYVKAGALPAGTTLDTLAPTRGASDTKWDDKTRQFVTAIRIAEGGDALVVMEESAHDYFKRQIKLGQFNEATVDNWRKQVEAGWSGKMEYTEMHEWLAKYAVGYAMGKVQETEANNLPLSFKRFLDRFAKLFRESLDFAAKVMQMERDGVLPAQFLRALQEATGTADNRGVNEVPLMSELDQEMATEAMKADTFPKIEGNEEAGWTVSDPDGLLIATASTLEDAQDKAMAWYMSQELKGEKQAAKNQGVKASEELQRVIIMKGGLLAPSAGDMSGELKAIADNMDAGKRLRFFRKNAMGLDAMREALVGEGFQFQTVNDLLVALDESTRGNPVYAKGGEETFSLSDSRAKPADASNVTVLPDGAQLVGPTTFSITAFHGTPHKVDKFSMDKIGTGEGAQAYGWGLYFAEKKEIAQFYREKMGGPPRFQYYVDGKPVDVWAGDTLKNDNGEELSFSADEKSIIKAALSGPGGLVVGLQSEAAMSRKQATKKGGYWEAMAKTAEALLARITENKEGAGNLYTVELLPNADEFLDWDKPLSEQSDKVKAALGKAGRFTQQERTTLPIRNVLESLGTAKEASEKLLAAGIPGIRYLDGASRGKGGTSNYVIFDESLVKIIEENGKKVEQAGATFSLQTETPAFKAFFKGSKVVDAKGKPLVVYHGTRGAAEESGFAFDYSRIGSQGRAEGAGFYFTTDKNVSAGYAEGGLNMEVFLSIKKPMAYDMAGFKRGVLSKLIMRVAEIEAERDGAKIGDGFLSNYGDVDSDGVGSVVRAAVDIISNDATALDQISGIVGSGVSPAVVNAAVRDVTGYDGVKANGFGNLGSDTNTIWVAFFPEQIKSATGNRGTFDPANPDITMSLAVNPANRPKTSAEIAASQEIDRIFAMQKLKSWQRLGLAAVADMQRETQVERVKAANNVARLENNGEFGDAMGRFFLTIRSELDRFAPGLGTLLEISSQEKATKTARDKKVIVALGEKITALPNANLILEQFRVLARRDDRTNLETLARANGFAKELAAAEAMLTDIRRDIIEAGEDYSRFWSQPANFEASDAFKADMETAKRVRKGRVGEAVERVLANYGFTKNIEFYWPSKVFDVKGLQEFMRGSVVGSKMEQAYRALEAEAIRKGKAIDEEDLDEMVSKLVANRGKAGPSALKGRTIANEDINFAMMQFYLDPIETALNHVDSMRAKIHQRQFFGKSIKLDIKKDRGTGAAPIDLVNSTGELIGALADQGKLDDQTKNNLKKLIDARFNPTPSMRAVNVMKALGYVFGLGQAYSGLTASIDGLGIGLRENSVNPVGVFTGLIQAVTGKNKITLEEAGIDIRNIGAEFQSGEKWEDSMVRWVFKWNGLTYLSKTFIQAGLNAALNNAIKTAKNGNMSGLQQKRLDRLFGQDAAQVEAMLAAGQKTPETMLFAWSTVATYQPISQDQQSQAMLTSQYGKLFFQFRSFLTVQFSGMRDDAYNEIKSGDKTRMMNGTKQLLALTATLLMLGLPMEALKAWLTGRTFILDEQITNRLLGLIGLNAYVTREARRDPIRGATSLVVPAVGSTVSDLWRDGLDLVTYAQASDQTDMTLAELLLNARTLSNVPFVGRIYDERLGSNAERNAQQREDIGWFVTTKPKEEGADDETLTRKIKALEKRVQGN